MPQITREITRSSAKDFNGKQVLTREFIVSEALPPETAIGAPKLPNINDPHPSVPNARADAINVQPLGDGNGARVTVTYSTDRSFRFPERPPKPDEVAGGFPLWNFAWASKVIPIPYAVRETVTIPLPEGGEQTIRVWATRSQDIETRMVVARLRVTIATLGVTELYTIQRQSGAIHYLPGVDQAWAWRFTNASAVQRSDSKWDIEYSWEMDPGTPEIAYNPNIDAVFPQPLTGEYAGYIRPPHHQFLAVPSEDPENIPPDFEVFRPWALIPNGWQQLPGVNL